MSDTDWEDDDCLICLAMKVAEKTGKYPNMEELKKLFEEQNKKNMEKVKEGEPAQEEELIGDN